MKKLFFITLIFLLQTFPSMSSPKGKGIICKCTEVNCSFKKSGHFFSKTKVTGYFFDKVKNEIVIEKWEDDSYDVSSKKIKWNYLDSGLFILDRETLKLIIDFPSFKKKYYRQFEIYIGFSFNRELKKLKKLYQKNYNKI